MDMNLFTIRRYTIEVTLLKACFSAVRDKIHFYMDIREF